MKLAIYYMFRMNSFLYATPFTQTAISVQNISVAGQYYVLHIYKQWVLIRIVWFQPSRSWRAELRRVGRQTIWSPLLCASTWLQSACKFHSEFQRAALSAICNKWKIRSYISFVKKFKIYLRTSEKISLLGGYYFIVYFRQSCRTVLDETIGFKDTYL